VAPEKPVDFALLACDELTGLIVATTLVRPSKNIADVTLKSLRKKWKDQSFAAGVKRHEVEIATANFSRVCFAGTLDLWTHIDNVLQAMQQHAGALELDGRLAEAHERSDPVGQ
jgi:predicted hydrolase (HD superfamily)